MAKKKSAVKKKKSAKPVKKRIKKNKSKKVLAIPKGYHAITPYLMVSNASEAIEFYKKAFGAKEKMRFSGPEGKVAHAELQMGDSKIMLSDMGMAKNAFSSQMSIHLYVKNVDKTVEQAIAAGARLIQPVGNKFYGDRSGMVVDPFGHQWNIATHVEDVSMKEMKKRMEAL